MCNEVSDFHRLCVTQPGGNETGRVAHNCGICPLVDHSQGNIAVRQRARPNVFTCSVVTDLFREREGDREGARESERASARARARERERERERESVV